MGLYDHVTSILKGTSVCDCVRHTGASGSVRSRNEYIEGYVCVTA